MAAMMDAPHTVSSYFEHLLQLKRAGEASDPAAAFQAGAMHILQLKQVHRELCEATEGLRESTAEAKSQLDQSSLQLQNLLYEQHHYEKEIASCRAFTSAFPDEQLELVPVEEFRESWRVQRNELASDDPHTLMLNRLSHELMSREETVKALEAVKAKRDALAAAVAQKRGLLGALEGEVAKLRAAAQKVAAQFAIPPPALSEASRLAAMLPLPLYVLYSQLGAAAASLPADCPVAVRLEVAGGGEGSAAAAAVERLRAMHRSASTPSAAGLVGEQPAAPAAAGPLEPFPLSLTLSLRKKPVNPAANPRLAVSFRYLPALGLVTAAGANPNPHTRAEQDAALAGLFPGDDGSALPDAAVANGAGADVNVAQLPGRPYRWAQHAAGIDILPPLPPQMYTTAAAAASEGLEAAAAALQQFQAERRAAAVLDKLVEAAAAPRQPKATAS